MLFPDLRPEKLCWVKSKAKTFLQLKNIVAQILVHRFISPFYDRQRRLHFVTNFGYLMHEL